MAKVSVLLEFEAQQPESFGLFSAALESTSDAEEQTRPLLDRVAGLGVELEQPAPIPMFSAPTSPQPALALTDFATPETNRDVEAWTLVVAAQADASQVEQLNAMGDVHVWANSDLILYPSWPVAAEDVEDEEAPREAAAAGVVDCRPFHPGVPIDTIRVELGVQEVWDRGFRGEGIRVAITDEGVNGQAYPVTGGATGVTGHAPGSAPVTSHGSMCAADVLIAAPDAELFDYPFLGIQNSGGALTMFQQVLDHRRLDGTPQVTNSSYGFVGVPDRTQFPGHEVFDINHPVHRKVREVVASGAVSFFAAGNCGANCPSGNCQRSGIGPGRSIHGSNSLAEVITIAAVNSARERIGYSSQGPGMFEHDKPDLSSYSHMFGNFGPGRPGGTAEAPFDNGTSAATPVASGVAALLLSAVPGTSPDAMRAALVKGAKKVAEADWDPEVGRGVIHAGAAFIALQ
jgi:subtilisin family serine protease